MISTMIILCIEYMCSMYCVCTLDTYRILHEVYHSLYYALDIFTAVYFMYVH